MASDSEVNLMDYLEEKGLGEAQDPAKVTNGNYGEEAPPAVKRNKVWIKFCTLLLKRFVIVFKF